MRPKTRFLTTLRNRFLTFYRHNEFQTHNGAVSTILGDAGGDGEGKRSNTG